MKMFHNVRHDISSCRFPFGFISVSTRKVFLFESIYKVVNFKKWQCSLKSSVEATITRVLSIILK